MDWESDARGEKQVGAIAKALKGAKHAVSRHRPGPRGRGDLLACPGDAGDKKALKGVEVRRITFNEITRNAIRYAIAHPRELDQPLIEAYLARRALDYLVGFTLSPVLWRKLPGSRIGRPGAVGRAAADLRARGRDRGLPGPRILDRRGDVHHPGGRAVHRPADPSGRQAARAVRPARTRPLAHARQGGGRGRRFTVGSVERKRVKRNPPPPFTTSTLQQEASRKLGFGAQQTMRLAQQLYEGVEIGGETTGLITYMRTDGVQMAREAIAAIRDHVEATASARTTCPARRANTPARPRTPRRRTRRSGRPMSPARRTASRAA